MTTRPVQKEMSPRAWAELMVLALLWGGTFLAVRVALDEIGPFTIVAHRVGWGMIALWAVVLARRSRVPRDPRLWAAFAVMGLLNNIVPFSLQAWAQLHVETGLVAILNAATAIFGVIAAALFFADERLTGRRAVGVVVGFFGVAVAVGLGNLGYLDLRSLAQLAVIGSTISYALAGVWARKRLGGLDPVVAAAGMLTASTLIALPLAWQIEGPPSLALAPRTWAGIAWFALMSTALAYLLYYRVLAMAGSGNLMLCTLLVAPVAIVLGALFLGEELGLKAYLGFGLLALGLIILDGRLLRRGRGR